MIVTADRAYARKAHPVDLPRVAGSLSRAYFADPVFAWAIPHPARRQEILPPLFALFAAAFARHDEIYVDLDVSGAALWAPPGQSAIREPDADEFGRRMEDILGVYSMRTAAILETLEANHPEAPHFYLNRLGVDPGRQGQGIGTALMAPVLARCDRERLPAYLEATSPGNRRLYERHGFVVTRELVVPDGPTLFAMWREPRIRS